MDCDPNRRRHLPKLSREFYEGTAMIHWTLTMEKTATGWLTESFHAVFREVLLHAAARHRVLCPVYCMMPEHIHLVWCGVAQGTDQRRAMKFLREHLASALSPYRFQHQAHDHVLDEASRARCAFENACAYVLENPVRAGLSSSPVEWLWTGAVVPGFPTLHPLQQKFWRIFWEHYHVLISAIPRGARQRGLAE